MADRPLFNLDTKGRWRLAYDAQQWVIQRRKGPPRPSGVVPGRASGWMAVSRRQQEGDAGALISREGHRPDTRGTSPARRVARAVPGFHIGPGEVRRTA